MNESLRLIIFTYKDPELCEIVADLLYELGYKLETGGNIPTNVYGYRITGGNVNWCSEPNIYRSHEFGDSEYPVKLNARIQMDEVREALSMKKKTTKEKELPKRRRLIIKVHRDVELSMMVQKIAFSAGFKWRDDKNINTEPTDGLLFGWKDCNDFNIFTCVGASIEDIIADCGFSAKPPILDARTDLGDIMFYFTGGTELNLKMLVSPGLIQFIKSNHKDEIVGGFIRKELGINLPPEVQKGGANKIFEWIMKAKAIDVPKPKMVFKDEDLPVFFRVVLSSVSTGRDYWSRKDLVTMEGEIPQSVIDKSIVKKDPKIVSDWMLLNAHNLVELDREVGDRNISESEEDDDSPEFESVIDLSDIEKKLKQIMKKA